MSKELANTHACIESSLSAFWQTLPTGNEEVSLEFAHKGSLIHGLLQFYSSKNSIQKPSLAYDKQNMWGWKCQSSFVQATAVHFFSVKLLKKKMESSKGIKQAHETWFRFYCHKQNQQRRFPTLTSCDHLFCEFLLNSLMISNNVIILEKQRTPFHFSIIVMHDTSVPEWPSKCTICIMTLVSVTPPNVL